MTATRLLIAGSLGLLIVGSYALAFKAIVVADRAAQREGWTR
jgi:hypothetical protein